ncbi:MAG: leucine-rich repeat domain-containing protein, partial [Firmicutes bacterium]|nr:leucine-rich repeat domain-containing protein [Bacillota bacterium]
MKILSKIRVGGVLLIVLSLLLGMMPAAAFATDVPVLLSASEAGVDVEVSENITLTSQEGAAELIVSDLTVKNIASIGSVEVTCISATAENGWSLASADSGFESMQANAKKLYLGYGNHDFSTGSLSVSDMEITPGMTKTIKLSAKSGIVTENIAGTEVARVVLTLGLKKIKVGDTDITVNAEEGGLYDANGVMLASWDDLVNNYGLDTAAEYSSSSSAENYYLTTETSGTRIINKNSELSNATTLIIPDNGATKISSNCFAGLSKLTKITIGDNVSTEPSAFRNCTSLTEVDLCDEVSSISSTTFSECTNLMKINVDGNNQVYTSQNGVLYDNDMSKLILVPNGNTGDFNIPTTVATIGPHAFFACSNITAINIPDSVKTIETTAFINCSGLTQLTIPESVTAITGTGNFAGCSALTEISLPSGISEITQAMFSDCTNLKELIIPPNVKSIGQEAFYHCSSLERVVLPEGIETVGSSSFRGSGITSIVFPASVTTISSQAFTMCDMLETVYFKHEEALPQIDLFTFGSKTLGKGKQCTIYFKNSTVKDAMPSLSYASGYYSLSDD